MAKNFSQNRRLSTYPRRMHYMLVVAHCQNQYLDKSKFLLQLVEKFFAEMNQVQRDKLIKMYNEMTPGEKKYPGRFKEE